MIYTEEQLSACYWHVIYPNPQGLDQTPQSLQDRMEDVLFKSWAACAPRPWGAVVPFTKPQLDLDHELTYTEAKAVAAALDQKALEE